MSQKSASAHIVLISHDILVEEEKKKKSQKTQNPVVSDLIRSVP